ncbi:MAG: TlpA family protein disulfide reductase [Chloroflexi bacterium]|nr:TlpA family protein disulfide reductase [Chloroflexota bacterium]
MSKRLKVTSFIIFASLLMVSCGPSLSESEVSEMVSQPEVEQSTSQESPGDQVEGNGQRNTTPNWYSSELTDVNTGMVFRVSDFQGKVILVETMAIWCPKCLTQQKEVSRLHDILGDRDDFVSLGINTDPNENAQQLSTYVMNNGFDWLYVVASDELINEISEIYGPQFLNPPSTPMLIIDRQGEAHLLPFGVKSAEELQTFLMPFFEEV